MAEYIGYPNSPHDTRSPARFTQFGAAPTKAENTPADLARCGALASLPCTAADQARRGAALLQPHALCSTLPDMAAEAGCPFASLARRGETVAATETVDPETRLARRGTNATQATTSASLSAVYDWREVLAPVFDRLGAAHAGPPASFARRGAPVGVHHRPAGRRSAAVRGGAAASATNAARVPSFASKYATPASDDRSG